MIAYRYLLERKNLVEYVSEPRFPKVLKRTDFNIVLPSPWFQSGVEDPTVTFFSSKLIGCLNFTQKHLHGRH